MVVMRPPSSQVGGDVSASSQTPNPRQPPQPEHQTLLSNLPKTHNKGSRSLASRRIKSNTAVESPSQQTIEVPKRIIPGPTAKDEVSSRPAVLNTITFFKALADGQEYNNNSDTIVQMTKDEFEFVQAKLRQDDKLRGWLEDKAR